MRGAILRRESNPAKITPAMREIIFDTETTGLDPRAGDRLVEIGLIELVNHIPSGRTLHSYFNPERPVSPDALRVHGLADKFLADKPLFRAFADQLLEFVGDAKLIAHNASFDMSFVNAELGRLGRPAIPDDRVVDTLMLARRKHPGAQNSLDALCARYNIDTSRRTLHGALLDSELLAEVYVELIGGRQAALLLGEAVETPAAAVAQFVGEIGQRPTPRNFSVTAEEIAAHRKSIAAIGSAAIWNAYPTDEPAG
jgi:DNA polymerase-3 subunit epsilon